MVRQSQNTIFLMLFPDPNFGSDSWRYTNDNLQSDRIRFIKWPYDTAMQSSVLGFPVMRYKEVDLDYGPTMWWLSQIEMGAPVVYGYHKVYASIAQPALVGHNHYVIHRSLPYVYATQFGRLWLQMGGCLACERVIFQTQHSYHMAEESYGEYLNPDQMRQLKAKSVLLPTGVVTPDYPLAPEATTEPPRIVYNHRFEAYKDPKTTFEVIDALRLNHPALEVWVTQAAGQHTRQYHYDRVVYGARRAEYLQNICVPAVNTINSLHETMCYAAVDSLALGHLGVFPNAITFPELVPKGYPYLFNSAAEQSRMLHDIFTTWPQEYNKWRLPLAEHARATFGVAPYVTRYLQVMAEVENSHRIVDRKEGTAAGMNAVFGAMTKGKVYPLKDLTLKIRSETGLAHQSWPMRRTVREAMIRGDIDLCWRDGITLTRR